MKKLLRFIGFSSLFLVALITVLAFSAPGFAESSNDKSDTSFDYIEGQLVVSVEENPNAASMQRTDDAIFNSNKLEQNGFQVVDSMFGNNQTMSNNFKSEAVKQMGSVYLIEYSQSEYKDIDKAKKELEKNLKDLDLDIRYIQENYTVHALEEASDTTPLDIHPEQEWNYDMIEAPEAWDTTPGSSNTKIAVLDTGIDSDHPNLEDFVDTSLGKSFVGGDTEDGAGHGTHVSGTIASYGDVSGVMEEATLIPVKVLDDDGNGSMYNIQQGITHAADEDADVINMSLGGGGYDNAMEEAIETANDQGTIVVAASGNDGEQDVSYPAAYNNTVAVGSVTSDKSRSSFSNYGEELDVMAPGSDIYSTTLDGDYETMSGTSMATPHVVGVMGLIRSADADVSVDDATSILKETAEDAGSDQEYGHGIVDANEAVQEANDGDGGEDPPTPEPEEWQANTWYETDDVVTYNGGSYVCQSPHYSYAGGEPPYTPLYWTEK